MPFLNNLFSGLPAGAQGAGNTNPPTNGAPQNLQNFRYNPPAQQNDNADGPRARNEIAPQEASEETSPVGNALGSLSFGNLRGGAAGAVDNLERTGPVSAAPVAFGNLRGGAAGAVANLERTGPVAPDVSREQRANLAIRNQMTTTTLAFAPEVEQPVAVDPSDGITLAELDGGNFPIHARGASIRKPELIGVFNYEPVFLGTNSQDQDKILTDAGKFIDTQINARKIRISDIENLFGQLSADPESPTGKIAQNMIDILEGKISETKEDFATIETASRSVTMFLDALNLRNPSDSMAQRFLQHRKLRFNQNPLLLPARFERAMDFRTILKKNHGFTEQQLNEFSSTKLFLYFIYDIRSLLMGPIENPNYPVPYSGDQSLKQRRSTTPSGRDNFQPRKGILHQVGQTQIASAGDRLFSIPLIDATDRYGRGAFGNGVCSIRLAPINGEEDSFSFLPKAAPLGGDGQSTAILVESKDLYRSNRAGFGCGLIASTICTDLAFSSALGDDEFVKKLKQSFAPITNSSRVADRLTPVVSGFVNIDANGNTAGAARLTADRSTLTGTVFYDDPQGDEIDSDKPVKIFDPTEPGPVQNGVQQVVVNTPYNKFLKPVISSVNEPASDDQALRGFLQNVPGRFKAAAEVMDHMFATNDPVLSPRALLLRVLRNIKNRVADLNIADDLTPEGSLVTGPAIDFCALSQGWADASTSSTIEFDRNTIGLNETYNYSVYKTNDLLTMFVISLAKTYSGVGKYSGVIPSANESESVNYARLSMDLADLIHLNLFNAPLETGSRRQTGLTEVLTPTVSVQVGEPNGRDDGRQSVQQDIADVTDNLKAFGRTRGVTRTQDFEGKDFSSSRGEEGLKYTNWSVLATAVRSILAAAPGPLDLLADVPVGQLNIPDGHYSEGSRGARYGSGGETFGQLKFDEGNSATPVKRFRGSEVKNRLKRVTGEAYDRSIFKDIITDLDVIFEAASSRGPIIDSATGRMISSGVDPAYLASLLLSMYGHIIHRLLGLRFIPQSLTDGNGGPNGGVESAWLANSENYERPGDTLAVMAIMNIAKSREFIRELNDFVDSGINPDPGKPFGLFLREFDKVVDHNQSVTLDTIDFFKSLSDQLETSGRTFLSIFQSGDQQQVGNEASIERVRSILPLAIQPSQIASMKKQLDDVERKSGLDRYFDDFFVDQSQENFMYTLLSGEGPNKFRLDNNNRPLQFNSLHGSNMDIVTVGIPQGFTENILQVSPVDSPDDFDSRKVDVYLFARDHVVAGGINIYPGKWTFDMGLFYNSVSDPVSSSPETRPQISNEQSIDFYNSVTGRPFPEVNSALNSNITLKRIKINPKQPDVISRPTSLEEQEIFDNHVYDYLAKVYIKITTGMDVGEENFLIDTELERKAANNPDLTVLRSLLNTHLSSLLGREVTFDDYLAGNRRFRELLQRLESGVKTSQIVDQIKAKVVGATPEQDMLSSEDMVTFSRMISPKNPIITPGLMREKIVSPRVFERVFCLFVDPDKIRATPVSTQQRNQIVEQYRESAGLAIEGGNITYNEGRLTGDLGNIPRARAYEVLVVPHGTPVTAGNSIVLASDFRDF